MAIVAPASGEAFKKNVILVLFITAFAVWFAYDGWIGWPKKNDDVVALIKNDTAHTPPIYQDTLTAWPGWANSTQAQRDQMHDIVQKTNHEGWHSTLDILFQKVIVLGLGLGAVGAFIYTLSAKRRRAYVDEQGLSPRPGLLIPWPNITAIDNTRWKKSGIITLTYRDAAGAEQTATLDDYQLDNLAPLLSEAAVQAKNARIIQPPQADAITPAP